MRRGAVRTLGISDLRKRIEPSPFYKTLGKRLRAERERPDVKGAYQRIEPRYVILISLAVHIADHDVRLRHRADAPVFHHKPRIAYMPPYQRRVHSQRLSEARARAAQNLVVLRLRYASLRILAEVRRNAGIPV